MVPASTQIPASVKIPGGTTPGPRTPAVRRAAVVTGLAVAGLCGTALPAQAADAYRYWGYSHLAEGKWSVATTGPAQYTPKDGAVEGWRYALVAGTQPRLPRDVVTFEDVCGSTAAEAGKKRVGVVVDPGRTVDAAQASTQVPQPSAECVVVDPQATGQQVLAAAGAVREQKGLVCAIETYPATGCGDSVAAAKVSAEAKAADQPVEIEAASQESGESASTTGSDTDSGSSNTGQVIAGVGVVAALAALGALLLRQRRRN